MIHLLTLNPALDLFLGLKEPSQGKIGEAGSPTVTAGGKALNIARFMGKWGVRHRVWLGTGGGSDPTHVLYRALLKREGIPVSFLSKTARIRWNVVVHRNNRSQKYNHPGYRLESRIFSNLKNQVRKNDYLVLTGRLPQGMNTSLYAHWIRFFNRKGVKTIVDTSGKALREALKATPWFFKINLYELSEALGRRITQLGPVPALVKKQFLKRGLTHGSVTDGPRGAVIWRGKEILRVESTLKVKNNLVVGAGDGFLAGYLKGFAGGKSFMDCARLASASGTAVASKGIDGFDSKGVVWQMKFVHVSKLRTFNKTKALL